MYLVQIPGFEIFSLRKIIIAKIFKMHLLYTLIMFKNDEGVFRGVNCEKFQNALIIYPNYV